jgi:glycosyltransferase involved in cell wall biosynthesis
MLARGTWLARRLDVPYVLTLHDYLGPRDRLRLDRRLARKVIAVSRSVRAELLEQVPLPDGLVTVVHAGVETPAAEDAPPVLDPENVPVIGTAGPLEAVKGLPYFLGAARRVHAVRP